MKKRIKIRNIICFISMIFAMLMPMTVSAASETPSLRIQYYNGNDPIPNVFFHIFRIADVSEKGEYMITNDFSDYSISLDDLNDEDGALATTLAVYADRYNIAYEAEGNTDKNRNLYFSDMPAGVYLLTGDVVTLDNDIYFPQPSIVPVPELNNDGTLSLSDEVTIEQDFESRPSDEKIERKVLMSWKDGDNKKNRPKEITVQLLRDGEVYDEQTLNAKNNWGHTWKELDPTYNLQILEKEVPKNYKLTVKQQDITFTLTNTYQKTNDQPTTTPTISTSSDTPTPNEPTPNTPDTQSDKLQQTGFLWWHVPILIAIGVVLYLIVVIVYKGRKHDK